jgi:hypothetical protein
MNKLLNLATGIIVCLAITSCKEDNDKPPGEFFTLSPDPVCLNSLSAAEFYPHEIFIMFEPSIDIDEAQSLFELYGVILNYVAENEDPNAPDAYNVLVPDGKEKAYVCTLRGRPEVTSAILHTIISEPQ